MRTARTIPVFIMAFFVLGIGAKDCIDFGGKLNMPPPSTSTPPTKLFCYTDPPIGCAAFCSAVGMISFTSHCRDVDANMREEDFEKDVKNASIAAMAHGYDVCPPQDVNNPNKFTTPCRDGLPPVEWLNQDHEVCQTPPLDCSIILP